MGIIKVKDRDGAVHKLKAEIGSTIMEIIRDAGLDIEAACGGCCACATCHVYVDADWLSKVGEAEEMEKDMLDFAFDVADNSRLSCCIKVSSELDGLIVRLPEKQF